MSKETINYLANVLNGMATGSSSVYFIKPISWNCSVNTYVGDNILIRSFTFNFQMTSLN